MRAIAALCMVLLPLMAAGADAQEPAAGDLDDSNVYREYPDPEPGAPSPRLGIVFGLVSEETVITVQPRQPFDIYLVAYDTQIALRGWEARVELDPGIQVLDLQVDGVRMGQDPDFYVGLKPEFCKDGPRIVLLHYRAMVLEEGLVDLPIRLSPTSRSSFEPPSPGYLVCRPGADLRPFEHCGTCAVVNPDRLLPEGAEPSPESGELFTPARGRH